MEFAERKLPEYSHMNAKEGMTKRNGTQVGDPAKAAAAMYKFATMKVCLFPSLLELMSFCLSLHAGLRGQRRERRVKGSSEEITIL